VYMKVSDYIMNVIADLGVKHVFFLSGGGAMHLNDSLGRNERLTAVCMLHEQSCAIAAEAYARITEGYGACLVTSGPGGTNTITGLAGAYLDSTPVIFISGQVKRADRINGQGIRQFGIQEVDIISVVKPLTKYAVQIEEPEHIRYELEKAVAIAKNGRPGPVWIDVPLDIQAMQVEPERLKPYDTSVLENITLNTADVDRTIELMNAAKRPVLLIGNGIRLAGGVAEARMLCEALGFPILTTWNGVDLIEDDHPLFFGRPGAVGLRYSNFIQQNADFVLTIGTRLNLLSTGFDFESFLKKANHVMVDIDENEMKKCSVHPQLAVHADAKDFIVALLNKRQEINTGNREGWLAQCKIWKERYPLFISEQQPGKEFVNTYQLVSEIANQMTEDDIYQFTSSGTGADISMQTFRIKKGQRAFLTKGLASMGFDLPASIGSCLASGGRRTVCVTGDGGFMMNIQELETLRRLALPVKIFVLDNHGYGMIYNSQNGNFNGFLTGCNQESGLTIPDINQIAKAFGIETFTITNQEEMPELIQEALKSRNPVVCTVKVDITQKILPRQTNFMQQNGQMASRPLEDMSPLLDRNEFEENLL
jgi:acetolactate synthase-1/2/3 large subunit